MMLWLEWSIEDLQVIGQTVTAPLGIPDSGRIMQYQNKYSTEVMLKIKNARMWMA